MSERRNELWPMHHSVPLRGLYPRGMKQKPMQFEQREFCENMALSIFADMVNAGRSFQSALASIYLSGIDHALNGDPS